MVPPHLKLVCFFLKFLVRLPQWWRFTGQPHLQILGVPARPKSQGFFLSRRFGGFWLGAFLTGQDVNIVGGLVVSFSAGDGVAAETWTAAGCRVFVNLWAAGI